MFAKGARFPSEKPSDIPGPGSYKIPEESRLEAYKKGAFLEKADRFEVEKGSDVPGPGAYVVGPRASTSRPGPSKPQKPDPKVLHLQQQIEALKAQNTRLLKDHQQAVQKYQDKVTHNDSTIKSLVKDNVTLQSQLSTEQKAHRSGCQREAALRTALGKAEASTKSEAERASKLAALQRKFQDLEKLHSDDKQRHASEVVRLTYELDASRKATCEQNELVVQLRKHRETSELRMKDLKRTIVADQAEIKDLRTKAQNSAQAEAQLTSCRDEAEELRNSLQTLKLEYKALTRSSQEAQTSATEERQRLIDVQATLMNVTEAYGHLAATSVPLEMHQQSELQCASLRLRIIRLERRLADREALVEQLTGYCRQASEAKSFLTAQVQELENDQRTLLSNHYLDNLTQPEHFSLICSWFDACQDGRQHHDTISQCDLRLSDAIGRFYQVAFNDLLVAYAMAHRENTKQSVIADRVVEHWTAAQTEINALRLDNSTAKSELSRKSVEASEILAREQALNERLEGCQRRIGKLEDTLAQERQTSDRLARTSHQSKMNEEHLRMEVDELVENVTDLTRYKEAHADLLAEVVALIQRNELAEAEADRLGKFNAEILGHKNPNQKIFYIDRIRRELAETKHRLLKSTRDREDLAADNAALHHEVAAYKSIAVPIELKSRGTRVRIERPPLATRNMNESITSIPLEVTPPQDEPIDSAPMTIEEIM